MKLYNYWRSSASWRVRIGLAFKGLDYEYVPVDLYGGEHKGDAYKEINPAGEVPLLDHDGLRIGQSLVILQYLDERYPERPLMPGALRDRLHALQICELVNSGIHPVQNLRVMKKLEADFGFDDAKKAAWAKHFITQGFTGLEVLLNQKAGSFALGDQFSIADCFITPMAYNARRYGVDMTQFPTISRVEASMLKHPAGIVSHPSTQKDAPSGA